MRHSACHFSISTLSRGKTAGAVARAAYVGRCRFHDERVGLTFSYRHLGGLLAEGTVNWYSGAEQLWNDVEASETRKNSRVARELKVALPAELPLAEMRRLLHGFCCNLKDRYELAAQWAIHAPEFHDKADGKRVEHQYRKGIIDQDEYLSVLSDPARTNRNFHAHILMSTRRMNHEAGSFTQKVRRLDNVRTGPQEIQEMRAEWEIRTNSALAHVGSNARIDLRSNKDMAAAGDAPNGLVAQPHLGPKARHGGEGRYGARVKIRAKVRLQNSELNSAWLQCRALERELARLEESEQIAAAREAARKKEAADEKKRILEARSDEDARKAAAEAVHVAAPRATLADIIARVRGGEKMEMPPSEDREIDPETYEREVSPTPFEEPIKVAQRCRTRVRTRTE